MEIGGGMIGVVQGAPSDVIQKLFYDAIVGRDGLRVAGVIAESHHLPDRMCTAGYLRSIGNARRFKIFEDQGPGAICHLDGEGALLAASAVRRDIEAGCDVVVLSKFGKLAAAGEGLLGAFTVAIERRIPLLTSVSPKAEAAWQSLTGSRFTMLPAEAGPVADWIALAARFRDRDRTGPDDQPGAARAASGISAPIP